MSDFFEQERAVDGPEDMVISAFSRCQNYPKERLGVLGLAQGLKKASDRFSVPMQAIVAACAEQSQYCPTDADLLNVARELKPADQAKGPRRCPRELCDGSGWRQVFHLHTHHARDGGGAWVEKLIITLAQFEELSQKVDWKTQSVYESRYRCACHPARQDEIEKRGKYA